MFNTPYVLSLPAGIDHRTYNIRKLKSFKEYYNACENRLNWIYNTFDFEKLFCHYCGSSDCKAIPGFLHDMSALNLWAYQRTDCSVVLCIECSNNYGKNHVSYNKRVSELQGRAKVAKGFLKFEPEILIPSIENIDRQIKYDINTGRLIGLTERAINTINYLSLNRESLIRKRLDIIERGFSNYNLKLLSPEEFFLLGFYLFKKFENERSKSKFVASNKDELKDLKTYQYAFYIRHNNIINEIINNLNENVNNFNSSITNLIKCNFIDIKLKDHYKSKRSDRIILGDKPTYDDIVTYGDKPTLGSFKFSGVRGFCSNQNLKFNGRNNILLLGENGVGKSTLLSCLKVALQKNFNISKYLDGSYDKSRLDISLTYSNGKKRYFHDNINLNINSHLYSYNSIYINDSRTSKKEVSKLIDNISLIADNKSILDWTLKSLNILLDFDNIELLDKNILVSDSKIHEKLHLDQLSSGYTSLICIFYRIIRKLDIFNSLNIGSIKKSLYNSIIFIDEIELHLHPIFKKGIVNRLSNAFPEAIFIMTTHDPLVISSCGKQCDIHLLEKNGSRTNINSDLPEHNNLSTEQLLTSPIFGLSTTSVGEKEYILEAYNDAIEKNDWQRIKEMRNELTELGLFGKTYRELLALSAVDAYLRMGVNPTIEDIIAEIKLGEDLNA
ncbi:AAA family ATPase [Photobacterium damselae]